MKRSMALKRVVVENGSERYDHCRRILENTRGVPVEPGGERSLRGNPKHMDMEKGVLRLLTYPGELLKPCPGTNGYICCGYQILNTGTNCPMNCSYCVLQAYVNQPSLRVYVNVEERIQEIGRIIDGQPQKVFRIGTGEFADSLALDPALGWSRVLVPFIQNHGNAVLEFKTKSTRVEGLLALQPRDRIVVSWSLNSSLVASAEEHGAPSIRKRLEAARRCQDEGLVVGFHFDPLIEHPDWRDSYRRSVELIDRYVWPKRIAWISLGCLRFMPSLKPIIRKRHPDSSVLRGEFIQAMDGKMRYFKPVRVEMYRYMRDRVMEWNSDCGLYLCMESDEVWEASLGWSPKDTEDLSAYLDERAKKVFHLSLDS